MAQSDLQRTVADLIAYFEGVAGEIGVLVEIHNATTRNANLLGVLSHRATGDARSYVGAAAVELAEASRAVRRAAELLEDSSRIAVGWAGQAVRDAPRPAAETSSSGTVRRRTAAVRPRAAGKGKGKGKEVGPPPRDADGVVRLSTTDPEHQHWLQNPPGDATIVVDGTFTYVTDATGRVTSASATLSEVDRNHPRSGSSQRNLPDREAGDHAGHIFARIFKGPGELVNLVPMVGGKVNLSSYKIIENEWKRAIADGKEVKVEIRLKYKSEARRPDLIHVDHWIDGRKFSQPIRNRPLGKRGTSDGST